LEQTAQSVEVLYSEEWMLRLIVTVTLLVTAAGPIGPSDFENIYIAKKNLKVQSDEKLAGVLIYIK
jgi:hypothetical protein